jgi:pimeloyl-ACP methyl ester carboxylesterase
LTAHLGLSKAALIGYSMGARISAFAMLDAPERFAAAVFGGLGINMVRGLGGGPEIVAGLEAEDPATVTNPTGRQFRAFAERTGSDLKALAACMKSSRVQITETEIKSIQAPVLVAVGDEDEVGGDPGELASLMPQGEALAIKGRDHMRATGDPLFKAGALAFFNRVL